MWFMTLMWPGQPLRRVFGALERVMLPGISEDLSAPGSTLFVSKSKPFVLTNAAKRATCTHQGRVRILS